MYAFSVTLIVQLSSKTKLGKIPLMFSSEESLLEMILFGNRVQTAFLPDDLGELCAECMAEPLECVLLKEEPTLPVLSHQS